MSFRHLTVSGATPRSEARALLRMVGRNGATVESVCELAGVPAEIENRLLTFLQFHPEECPQVLKVLEFRRATIEELRLQARERGLPCAESCNASTETATGTGESRAVAPPRDEFADPELDCLPEIEVPAEAT